MVTCQICRKNEARVRCSKCGRLVCPACAKAGLCDVCASEKMLQAARSAPVAPNPVGATTPPAVVAAKAATPAQTTCATGCLVALGLVVVLAVIGGIIGKNPSSGPAAKTPEAAVPAIEDTDPNSRKDFNGLDKVDVYSTAKRFVRDNLKAPGSAKFPWAAEEYFVNSIDSQRYRVSSWVDAQNSFGALLRNKWVVIMRYHGDGRWTLESIDLTEP